MKSLLVGKVAINNAYTVRLWFHNAIIAVNYCKTDARKDGIFLTFKKDKQVKIDEKVYNYLKEKDIKSVGWGDFGIIADMCKELSFNTMYDQHPMNRTISMLNRLEKSNLFIKKHYRCWTGSKEQLVRIFYRYDAI